MNNTVFIFMIASVVSALCIMPFAVQAQGGELHISQVRVVAESSEEQTASIAWVTEVPSQSLVVCGNYSNAPFVFDSTAPHFGYTWSTIVMKGLVTEHVVPLTELAPGMHYCRAASRVADTDSWAVSEEVAFDVSTLASFSEGVRVTEEGENDGTSGVQTIAEEGEGAFVAFASLSNVLSAGTCSTEWWIWIVVLAVLLVATTWPKEMRSTLTSKDTVMRLYAIAIVGVAVFIIAVISEVTYWVVPVGIGTIAVLAATVFDVVRTSENDTAMVRLIRVTITIIGTLTVALFAALALNWGCTVFPLIISLAAMAAQYYVLQKRDK